MKLHVSKKEQLNGAVSSKRKLVALKLKQTTMMTALPVIALVTMSSTSASASSILNMLLDSASDVSTAVADTYYGQPFSLKGSNYVNKSGQVVGVSGAYAYFLGYPSSGGGNGGGSGGNGGGSGGNGGGSGGNGGGSGGNGGGSGGNGGGSGGNGGGSGSSGNGFNKTPGLGTWFSNVVSGKAQVKTSVLNDTPGLGTLITGVLTPGSVKNTGVPKVNATPGLGTLISNILSPGSSVKSVVVNPTPGLGALLGGSLGNNLVVPDKTTNTETPGLGSWLGNLLGGGNKVDELGELGKIEEYEIVGYQAGVSLYEALPQVFKQMNGLSSLQQRVGNRKWVGAQDTAALNKDASLASNGANDGSGVWVRVEGSTADFQPKTSTSNSKYDLNQVKVQAGVDFVVNEGETGTWVAGVFGQYGHGKAKVTSYYGDGDIKVNAYGFGGTLTWYGNNDWYVDAQAQVNWFNADLDSKTAHTKLKDGVDGLGYAVSVEGGKKIALNDSWTMTPQAQLAWNSVDFDSFRDTWDAEVKSQDGDSLVGRVGVSFDHQNEWTGADGKSQRVQTYVIGNLYYDFLDDGTKIKVSNVSFKQENEQFWGGLGVGIAYNWSDDMYSIYGNVDARSAFNSFGDSYVVGGAVGFRVKF